MPSVFISYAHEDRPVVSHLAKGLKDAGFEVWWDDNLEAGQRFRTSIQDQLMKADVIIVVWSERSVQSQWVIAEAARRSGEGILLPLRIDSAPLPLGLSEIHTLDLADWGGEFDSSLWNRLLTEARRISGRGSMSSARPKIQIGRQVFATSLVWTAVPTSLILAFYSSRSQNGPVGLLTNPFIEALALALVTSLPISLLSAMEVRSFGFNSLHLVIRRSMWWLLRGAMLSAGLVAVAVAHGEIQGQNARAMLEELARAFILLSMVITSALCFGKLLWWGARHALGFEAGK
jgi:hypothetical protein